MARGEEVKPRIDTDCHGLKTKEADHVLLHELRTQVEVETQIVAFANCRHMDIVPSGEYQCFLCKKKLDNALTVCVQQVGSRTQLTFDCYYACAEKQACYPGEGFTAKKDSSTKESKI